MAHIFEVPMDNDRTRYQVVDEAVGEVRGALFLSLPGALGRGAIDLASLAQLPPELSEKNTEIGAYMFTAKQAAALLGNAYDENVHASAQAWGTTYPVGSGELHSGRFYDRNGYNAAGSTINPDGSLSVQPGMWSWNEYATDDLSKEASEAIVNTAVGLESERDAMAVYAHEVIIDDVGVRREEDRGTTIGYMDEHNTFRPQVTILTLHEYPQVPPFESSLNLVMHPILQRNDR